MSNQVNCVERHIPSLYSFRLLPFWLEEQQELFREQKHATKKTEWNDKMK